MKLSNIFKKETTSTTKKSKIESLDKKQLATVIGGTDESTASGTEDAAKTKPRYIVKADGIIYDAV